MGEQNSRLLRGAESRDVIFSGTDKRKKLGMAEVCLTVDNSDRTLPIDFAEVTVTRRIYRSGESQYLLNNSPCRLKDIVELFLDTGVGKGAYSFVSQSEIDAVLSARAEDRGELFEERQRESRNTASRSGKPSDDWRRRRRTSPAFATLSMSWSSSARRWRSRPVRRAATWS